jgi:hypothetical protein
MFCTLNGTSPAAAAGVANAATPKLTGVKELSKTLMPVALAAYN